jgi:hypothetical protein
MLLTLVVLFMLTCCCCNWIEEDMAPFRRLSGLQVGSKRSKVNRGSFAQERENGPGEATTRMSTPEARLVEERPWCARVATTRWASRGETTESHDGEEQRLGLPLLGARGGWAPFFSTSSSMTRGLRSRPGTTPASAWRLHMRDSCLHLLLVPGPDFGGWWGGWTRENLYFQFLFSGLSCKILKCVMTFFCCKKQVCTEVASSKSRRMVYELYCF